MNIIGSRDVNIRNCEKWIIHSDFVGRDFEISIAYPPTWFPEQEVYPVVYLLDSDSCFGLVVDAIRMLNVTGELPAIILVGIGYPEESLEAFADRRLQDFTPTKDAQYKRLWRSELDLTEDGGGAENFISFIRNELKPVINKNYPTDKSNSTLIGDSLAGLFSLFTLFKYPAVFDNYIIGSPAIFWDNGILWQYEKNYADNNKSLCARIFLGVGGDEDKQPFHFPAHSRHQMRHISLVKDTRSMVKTLESRQYAGLKVCGHVFEGETHMSVIAPCIIRGLRYALGLSDRQL